MTPLMAGALASGVVGGANAYMQGRTNKKTREHNQNMYNLQRGHALSDWTMQNAYNQGLWNQNNEYNQQMWHMQNSYNEERWNKQNEYDSPAAQMARFKAAGINPNAMFGNMSSGAPIDASQLAKSSQAPTAGLSSPNAPQWHANAPSLDFLNTIGVIMDAQQKGVVTDNLRQQNRILKTEELLKLMDVQLKAQQKEKGGYENSILKNTWHNSVQIAQQQLNGMIQDYTIKDFQNTRDQTASDDKHKQTPLNLSLLRQELSDKKQTHKYRAQDREMLPIEYMLRRNHKMPVDDMEDFTQKILSTLLGIVK